MTWSLDLGASNRTRVIVRGDTRKFRVTCYTPYLEGQSKDGPPPKLDLTDWVAVCTWKWKRPEGRPVFADIPVVRLTTDDDSEIRILDQGTEKTKGQLVLILQSTTTQFMEPGVYRYDVRLTSPEGDVCTVISDEIHVRDTPGSAEDLTSP